jgi:uncharacterized membrane protein
VSLIDQRILIVAPVEAVWTYVSDPALMSKWNKNCKQISVLTTRTTGVGTRRRCVGVDGRAVVEETTAYFENIGYEYHVVDGPYRDFRGRFRLQAIPEGTIVNWTVEYHLRGVLPGVRNALSFRRHYEDMMADSLRQLRRMVEASGIQLDPEKHARYAMQDGPSAEARASRSPELTRPAGSAAKGQRAMKAVSVGEDDLPEMPGADFAPPTVVRTPPPPPEAIPVGEPPIVLSDTAEILVPAGEEKHDTKPRPPHGLREAIAGQAEKDRCAPPDESDLERAATAPTVPVSLVAPPPEPPVAQETQTVPLQASPPPRLDVPSSLPENGPPSFPTPEPWQPFHEPPHSLEDTSAGQAAARKASEPEAIKPPPTDKRDTGEISIWDVFGIERPSERAQAELEAVIASLQPENALGKSRSAFTPSSSSRSASMRSKAKPKVRSVRKGMGRQKMQVHARGVARRG